MQYSIVETKRNNRTYTDDILKNYTFSTDNDWSPEEDEIILRLGNRFPGQWSFIASCLNGNMFVNGGLRSQSQCQARFQIIHQPSLDFINSNLNILEPTIDSNDFMNF